jgi:hypothetical protein
MDHALGLPGRLVNAASKPELLPRRAEGVQVRPRRELSPRMDESAHLKWIGRLLLLPVGAVWAISMGVFLLPLYPLVAWVIWSALGAGGHHEHAE